jgi:hypothetical protein
MNEFKHSEITEKIIAAAYTVHKQLGYGFMEKVYKNALLIELENLPFECKAVSKIDPMHEVQLVNYLKASNIEVGLLINFGKSVEIKRKIF